MRISGGAAASLPADAEGGVPPVRARRHSEGTLLPPEKWALEITMRTTHIITFAVCALISASCGDKSSESGSGKPAGGEILLAIPDDPAAVIISVNDSQLTVSQAMTRTEQRLKSAYDELPSEERDKRRPAMLDKVLNQFVMRTLLLEEAERVGITVSDEEIAAEFTRLDKSLQRFGKQMDDILENSATGEAHMRGEIITRMRIRRLLEKNAPTADPTDKDIKEFKRASRDGVPMPETVSARHILVRVTKEDAEPLRNEKRQTIEHVRRQLLAGSDFSQMASQFSDCPTKQSGGKLGNLPRGVMSRAFDNAAFSQEVGTVGKIVASRHGYHVILVDKRTPTSLVHPDRLPQKYLSAAVKAYMNKRAKDELLTRLQKQAKIDYADGIRSVSNDR